MDEKIINAMIEKYEQEIQVLNGCIQILQSEKFKIELEKILNKNKQENGE